MVSRALNDALVTVSQPLLEAWIVFYVYISTSHMN